MPYPSGQPGRSTQDESEGTDASVTPQTVGRGRRPPVPAWGPLTWTRWKAEVAEAAPLNGLQHPGRGLLPMRLVVGAPPSAPASPSR